MCGGVSGVMPGISHDESSKKSATPHRTILGCAAIEVPADGGDKGQALTRGHMFSFHFLAANFTAQML